MRAGSNSRMSVHGHRTERLADQIRDEVTEMVAGELKDPRIGLATVTLVELCPDLRHARVLVSVLGSEEAKLEALEGLSSSAGFVRRELGRRLRLRRMPEIVFVLDRGPEDQTRVESLLERLKLESLDA
jgi:ribosome-binding factor A